MQLHPGKKIQEELKDRGWTQRQFAFLLWKKVSEVNELIKGKRNITVQRDILLSHVLWTSRKYRLNLQNEYDYALLEADFDMSKLPKIDQKVESIEKKDHKKSEQDKKINSLDSGDKTIALEWRGIEKKETKSASDHEDNLHKGHTIEKDVDISTKQEKHPKQDWLKSTSLKTEQVKIDKIWWNFEKPIKWQEKKDDHKNHHKHKESIFRNF